MLKVFDTHAHYDDDRFDADRTEVLRALPESGVELVVNPGCDWESSQKAVSYARDYPYFYAAVGLHPENIEDDWEDALSRLEQLTRQEKKVRAVGEIGLDYYWEKDEARRARQREVFRRQMALAQKTGLPVIVHDRDAHADSLSITKEYPEVRGVYHCFSGAWPMAQELLSLGYYLSFTGVITYKNARRAVEVVENTPMDRLMIETDSPYMSPEPFRGRRNSSAYVYRMAEAIAQIKDMDAAEVARITLENGKRFFGI